MTVWALCYGARYAHTDVSCAHVTENGDCGRHRCSLVSCSTARSHMLHWLRNPLTSSDDHQQQALQSDNLPSSLLPSSSAAVQPAGPYLRRGCLPADEHRTLHHVLMTVSHQWTAANKGLRYVDATRTIAREIHQPLATRQGCPDENKLAFDDNDDDNIGTIFIAISSPIVLILNRV